MSTNCKDANGVAVSRTNDILFFDDDETLFNGIAPFDKKTEHSKKTFANFECTANEPVNPPVDRFQLEDFTPFSKSHLWKLMSSFYTQQGVDSWAQGVVPHFITSNAFIAKRYCQLLRAYFMDAKEDDVDPTEPFYIIELGAGSGKFSFYFLRMLCEYEHTFNFPLNKLRYIMTDFTAKNVAYWKTHIALKPFVQRGLLDFAIFDATKDTELRLSNASITIRHNDLKNGICVIANYLFDTLNHELFQIDKGVLKQGFISVGSRNKQENDLLDSEIITRMQNIYKYHRVDTNFYGSNVHLNHVLEWYLNYFTNNDSGGGNATILIPIGAIHALENLSALSNKKVLVLSGDKGTTNPDHFLGLNEPHIAVHGSFSLMVNYHALEIYANSRGGFAFHSPQEEASIKVSLFVLPQEPKCQSRVSACCLNDNSKTSPCKRSESGFSYRHPTFPNLAATYEDLIVSFGPNDFFVMQKAFKEEGKQPSIKSILALLKLSNWDPDVFYKFRDILLDKAPFSTSKLRTDLKFAIGEIWKNYYLLDKEKDLAFELARLYYGMQNYDNALLFYQLSIDIMGMHHVTCHNMGLCYYNKHQPTLALQHFGEAHRLNSSYQKAINWMQRVQREFPATKMACTNGTAPDTFSTTGDVRAD